MAHSRFPVTHGAHGVQRTGLDPIWTWCIQVGFGLDSVRIRFGSNSDPVRKQVGSDTDLFGWDPVWIRFGSSLDASGIRSGSDLDLVCPGGIRVGFGSDHPGGIRRGTVGARSS